MPARTSRWPLVVGILGIVLLVGALLWRFVAQPALVKYPTDLEGDAHAEGTITFFLDPDTKAPLDPPIEEDLVIDRHLEVDSDESDGDLAVVDEIDQQEIAGQQSELRQRYVIDRTSLENVADDRAFAYEEANVTDRSPAFAINLPFDAGDGPYEVWKNESGEAYEFTGGDTYEVDGVELRTYTGSADELPVTDAYVAALAPQGVPTELTLDELRPILLAAGLDLDVLLAALLPQLDPADVGALLEAAGRSVPLDYTLSVETEFGVEPRTGAIVDLASITQMVSARPDSAAIAPIADVLGRYPQVAEAVSALDTLNGFAEGEPIPVFEISYAQTDESVSETVAKADDLAGQITLATQTVPLALLVGGLVLVLVGLVGFILARRRTAPRLRLLRLRLLRLRLLRLRLLRLRRLRRRLLRRLLPSRRRRIRSLRRRPEPVLRIQRLEPSADVRRGLVGVRRSPRAPVVEADLGRVGHRVLDDAPLLLDGVGPAEAAVVALHGVLEQPLVRLLAMAEGLGEVDLEVDRAGAEVVARRLGLEVEHDAVVGPEAEPQVVRLGRRRAAARRTAAGAALELDHRLGGGDRQGLARPDQPRHAGPPPRVDLEPQRPRRSRCRSRPCTPVLVDVAPVLAPHHRCRVDRPDLAEHLDLLVVQGVGVGRRPAAPSPAGQRPRAGGSGRRRAARRPSRRTCPGPRRRTPRPS